MNDILRNARLNLRNNVTTLNTAHYNGTPTVQITRRGDRAGRNHHTLVTTVSSSLRMLDGRADFAVQRMYRIFELVKSQKCQQIYY